MSFDEYSSAAPSWYPPIATAIEDQDAELAKKLADAAVGKKRESASCIAAANARLAAGDTVGARSYADEAVQSASAGGWFSSKDQTSPPAATHLMARIALKDGSTQEAETKCDEALDMYKRASNEAGQAAVLITKAQCKVELENAMELLNEARDIFKRLKLGKGEKAALYATFQMKLRAGQPGNAREVADEIARVCESAGDKAGVAEAQLWLAQCAAASGDLQSAVFFAKTGAEQFGSLGNPKRKTQALCALADILRGAGQFANARKAADAALRLCQTGKDKHGQATAHCMTATICDSAGDFNKAAYHLGKAVRLFRQLKDKKEEAQTLESQANVSLKIFAELDDPNEPMKLCQKAMDLYKESDMAQSSEAGYLLQTMALATLALDKSDDALDTAKDSLNIFQLRADLRGEAAAQNVLAQIYAMRGDKIAAASASKQGLKAAEDAGDTAEAKWASQLLSEYDGRKEEQAKMGENRLTKGDSSVIYIYHWGKDYALFDQFTMRGTDAQVAKLSSSSSSSSAAAAGGKAAATAVEDPDLGIDWQGLGKL